MLPFDVLGQFADGTLVENPEHQVDQELVLAFVRLKGQPSRPIDREVFARSADDFKSRRTRLSSDFFEPFNRLLKLIEVREIRVEPDLSEIGAWNTPDFGQHLVDETVRHLDTIPTPRLVPYLVDLFLNLETERRPSADAWNAICAIVVPGSRTYDRAAEAYRAYRMGEGNAIFVVSGKAPYYDADNSAFELTESEANAAYLRLLGVPRAKIVSERESMDTVENAEFLAEALRALGHDHGDASCNVLLVTSPFHLARFRLNVETMLESLGVPVNLFSIGSRASRYWAETYFMTDAKSGYRREDTLGVVFNEYLKIAFDVCAQNRPLMIKPESPRAELPAESSG